MDELYDKCAWCRNKRGRGNNKINLSLNNPDDELKDDINLATTIEYVDEKVVGKPLLELKHLTKIFKGRKGDQDGRNNIAVNKLN